MKTLSQTNPSICIFHETRKKEAFSKFVSKKTPLSSIYNNEDKGVCLNVLFNYVYFKM